MRLIITEKPKVARALARALGLGQLDGDLPTGADPAGRPVTIAWALGHLVEIAGPEAHDPAWGKGSRWEVLPFFPERLLLQPSRQGGALLEALLGLIRSAAVTELVNAMDAGREGELIFGQLYRLSGSAKPVLRLWSSSLTESALAQAYRNLRPWADFRGLREAAEARAEADWLIGMNGSRALACLAQETLPEAGPSWPVGRVKTPTLALLVERDRTVRAEPAEGAWSLEIQVEFGEAQVAGQWAPPGGEPRTLADPAEAGRLAAGLAGTAAVLLSCERQPRSVPSPLLFDLTGLQREATHRFGLSAQDVLEAAQGLYEDRWISYPRTNSRCLTAEDAALAPEILAALRRHPEYEPSLQEIADQGWALGARIIDPLAVDDHPGLHPTPVCPGSLSGLPEPRRKVFDLIARRFLAAFYPDCQGHDLRLLIQAGAQTFRAAGFAQAQAGWLRVFPAIPEAITPQNLAPALGSLPAGARGWTLEARPIPWPRERPRPFSEAGLLGAMQNGGTSLEPWEEPSAAVGLGTAATRTRTLEDLLAGDQPLASRAGGLVQSTERGRTLIATLPVPALKSADLTRKWEAGLSAIQHGERSAADFMAEVRGQVSGVVQAMRDARDRANALAEPCPKCGAPLTLHRYPQVLLARCSASPGCPVQYAIHEDRTPVEGLCGKCGGPVGRTRKGFRLCNGCGAYQAQAPWLVEASSGSTVLDLPDPCPVCRQGRWEVKFGSFGGYVRCSAHPACKVTFGSMKGGIPKGGFCAECGGPCQETRNRKRVCVVCSKWQRE